MRKARDCCGAVKDNVELLSAHIAAKFRDDLLIGTQHSYKVTPACQTPQKSFLREQSDGVVS